MVVHVPMCSLPELSISLSSFTRALFLYSEVGLRLLSRGGVSTGSSVRLLLVVAPGQATTSEIFMAFFWSVSISRTNEALGDWALWRPIDPTRSIPTNPWPTKCPQTRILAQRKLAQETTCHRRVFSRCFRARNLREQSPSRGHFLALVFNQTIALFNKQASKHYQLNVCAPIFVGSSNVTAATQGIMPSDPELSHLVSNCGESHKSSSSL